MRERETESANFPTSKKTQRPHSFVDQILRLRRRPFWGVPTYIQSWKFFFFFLTLDPLWVRRSPTTTFLSKRVGKACLMMSSNPCDRPPVWQKKCLYTLCCAQVGRGGGVLPCVIFLQRIFNLPRLGHFLIGSKFEAGRLHYITTGWFARSTRESQFFELVRPFKTQVLCMYVQRPRLWETTCI